MIEVVVCAPKTAEIAWNRGLSGSEWRARSVLVEELWPSFKCSLGDMCLDGTWTKVVLMSKVMARLKKKRAGEVLHKTTLVSEKSR
jgi:hypothetical protein